ncbi:MAG: hypothetical protein CM1200mP2_17650 [Planctomycetaceae bacterium]|nr:MAG: hypothetical protein CM1200mP2_17650 [Planctomycetaceae bacterium]
MALRADMDALPIHEETDVDFRSEVDGKMHAWARLPQTPMLLGAGRLLKERESEIHGTVKLLFQPAEEGGAGGKLMSEEGCWRARPSRGSSDCTSGRNSKPGRPDLDPAPSWPLPAVSP